MNIQNNQSLEFERKTMLAPLRSVIDQRFPWLFKVFFKSFHDDRILFSNAKETLQKMLARKCSYRCKHEGLKIGVNSIIEATQFLL